MPPFSIPLFPLPTVVLFPNVLLPLHIFEPRYRQMVEAALGGDRMIGMVLLKPGYEADYEGSPAIYRTGCAGLITRGRTGGRRPLQPGAARCREVHYRERGRRRRRGQSGCSAMISPVEESLPDADREP